MRVFLAKAMCIAGLASGTILATPASAGTPTPAAPTGNPGDWATANDYPSDALRAEAEGVSRFRLEVAADGTVSSCTITESSGLDSLDRKTCEIVTLRAQFKPATDPAGKPVAGTWSSSVRWQIPRDAFPPDPSVVVFSMYVGADGAVSDCRFERIEGAQSLADKKVGEAQPCRTSRFTNPYKSAKGDAVGKRVRFTQQVEVLDAPPPAPIPPKGK